MRDQNHKIASMFSIVSTLAEDMHGVKMGLNHLAMTRANAPNLEKPKSVPFIQKNDSKLITVSDNEDDSEEESDSDLEESDNEEDSDLESDLESDNESFHDDIKVLKLNANEEDLEDLEDVEDLEDLEDVEDVEDELYETQSVSSETSKLISPFVEETLPLKYDNIDSEEPNVNIYASDLKTININLEESNFDSIDFKKLSLQKLRSLVVEKGLLEDASKSKKNELLKLLEDE
jgi:hypothetical protein